MAIMIPQNVPADAPQSEKIIFENLKYSPHTISWRVLCSKYIDNPDNPVKPRELDFIIFVDDYCTVIYLEAKGGHFEITDDLQWRIASSGRLLDRSPPVQAMSGMDALKRMAFSKNYFRDDLLISAGCAVAFTDWDVSFKRRPGELAELITKGDSQDPGRLGKRLLDYAEDLTRNVRAKLRKNECREALDDLLEDLKALYMPIEDREEPMMRITRSDLYQFAVTTPQIIYSRDPIRHSRESGNPLDHPA